MMKGIPVLVERNQEQIAHMRTLLPLRSGNIKFFRTSLSLLYLAFLTTMSSDPASMTLDGWSNQYVDESLWDEDDQGGRGLLAMDHAKISPPIRRDSNIGMTLGDSLVSLLSQNGGNTGIPLSFEEENWQIVPKLNFPLRFALQNNNPGSLSRTVMNQSRACNLSRVQLLKTKALKTRKVIDDVLKSLNEVIASKDDETITEVPSPITAHVPHCVPYNMGAHKALESAGEVTAKQPTLRLGSQGGLLVKSLQRSSPTDLRGTCLAPNSTRAEDHQKEKHPGMVLARTRTADDMVPAPVSPTFLRDQLSESYYRFVDSESKSASMHTEKPELNGTNPNILLFLNGAQRRKKKGIRLLQRHSLSKRGAYLYAV